MAIYAHEKEQIDELKELWKKYGLPLIWGVLLAFIILAAWRGYSNYRLQKMENASMLYQQALGGLINKDSQTLITANKAIVDKYPSSPYAAASTLLLAKYYVDQNDLKNASNYLTWVMQRAAMNSMKQIARIRLARLQLNEKKYDDALATLKTIDDTHYQNLIAEVTGDVEIAKNDLPAALNAYQTALKLTPKDSAARELLIIKFQAAGGEA